MLQAPYYLGLKHRVRAPGEPTPPPTPPPVEPRFVEMVSPFFSPRHETEQELSTPHESETHVEDDKLPGEEAAVEREGDGSATQKSNEGDSEGSGKDIWMDYLEFVKGFQ